MGTKQVAVPLVQPTGRKVLLPSLQLHLFGEQQLLLRPFPPPRSPAPPWGPKDPTIRGDCWA